MKPSSLINLLAAGFIAIVFFFFGKSCNPPCPKITTTTNHVVQGTPHTDTIPSTTTDSHADTVPTHTYRPPMPNHPSSHSASTQPSEPAHSACDVINVYKQLYRGKYSTATVYDSINGTLLGRSVTFDEKTIETTRVDTVFNWQMVDVPPRNEVYLGFGMAFTELATNSYVKAGFKNKKNMIITLGVDPISNGTIKIDAISLDALWKISLRKRH